MKILIVDDVTFMRKMLSDKITKLGHEVIEAYNGEDAVNKSRRECPDVVFMDVVMPKMDGITATKLITEELEGKVIICSVLSNRARVIEAIRAGASDYIVKPVDDERLREAINRHKK